MNRLGNYLGLQLLWLVAVAGAGHGHAWPALAGVAAFAAYQLRAGRRAHGDGRLVLLALACGLAVDSGLAAGGWVAYAAPWPGSALAPPWILALWAGFALTFNHSLAAVMRRPWLALALGAVFGPFSYWLAARSGHAVALQPPLREALLALAAGWGAACALLSVCTRRLATAAAPPLAGALR